MLRDTFHSFIITAENAVEDDDTHFYAKRRNPTIITVRGREL